MHLDVKVEHLIRSWVRLEEKRLESNTPLITAAIDRGVANTTPWPIPLGESARVPESKD